MSDSSNGDIVDTEVNGISNDSLNRETEIDKEDIFVERSGSKLEAIIEETIKESEDDYMP